MNHLHNKALLIAALSTLACGIAHADQEWKVTGGVALMDIRETNFNTLGIKVGRVQESGQSVAKMQNQRTFRINPNSDLRFVTHNGKFDVFEGGHIQVDGGFLLSQGKTQMNFIGFNVEPNGQSNQSGMTLSPMNAISANAQQGFLINQPMAGWDYQNNVLQLVMSDVVISRSMAKFLGDPSLAGELVGTIHFDLTASFTGGNANEGPVVDQGIESTVQDVGQIDCSNLGNTTARSGTYPTGKTGFGIQTESCGVGTGHVAWNAPMSTTHPTIAFNMYRIKDGKFEQIGEGWLKHGFLATNNNGCGTCGDPAGSYLGHNCSDIYGVGNNTDQNYLGPRNEVNPFTGQWNCVHSYFTNFSTSTGCPDQRSAANSGLGSVNHRLVVNDADLIGLTAANGDKIVYESYYITQFDENKYNQIGWRSAFPTWSTNRWTFSNTSGYNLGPAINGWGDMRTTATPRTDGDAIVAVKVTQISNGRYYYDYAVYVHDIDRQIRSFELPIESGFAVNNFQFRDTDQDATNDWTWSFSNGLLKFSTSTQAQNPNANTLSYGRTFNFRVLADSAPRLSHVNMGLFKPGSFSTIGADITGPEAPSPKPVHGTCTLGDYAGTPVPVTFTLTRNGTGEVTTYTANVGADGAFSFNTLERGIYKISAQGPHWLKQINGTSFTIDQTGALAPSLNLINGDVDHNNEVGLGDFGILSGAFGKMTGDPGFVANADLDGDGEVGLADFGVMSTNFGAVGD